MYLFDDDTLTGKQNTKSKRYQVDQLIGEETETMMSDTQAMRLLQKYNSKRVSSFTAESNPDAMLWQNTPKGSTK